LAQIILGGIQVCTNEGDYPSPRGDNSKIHFNVLTIFFSRASRTNSIKLSTNYLWVKGISVYSNIGSCPFLRGYNQKNVRMWWGCLKIFFSRTTGGTF
jgi:hypothetical protein